MVIPLLIPSFGSAACDLERTFSNREILGILVVSTIVIVFLTSVGSLLISALLVGLVVGCTHGAFRMPEDFLSTAAAAAPVVATRV
ncbi:hypothetical protein ACS0TY_033931 [Phlomoides rotata]